MLRENTFVLASSGNDFRGFIVHLENRFENLQLFDKMENLVSSLETVPLNYSCMGDSLIILFIEHLYIDKIYKYLEAKLNPTSYILISISRQQESDISSFTNVFEFININSKDFNMNFFMNKLNNEISTKNRLSLLQYEVKEYYEIGKSLSSEKDTVKLLEMIINSSISLTSSDAGTIYLVTDSQTGNWSSIKNNEYHNKVLKFVIAKNLSMDIRLEAFTSPITKASIFGYTLITGKPLRIDDAYAIPPELDYKHNRSFDTSTGYMTKSILSVPMKDHENNVLGVIQLINKNKSKNKKIDFPNSPSLSSIIPYDYTDELIMSSLSGQAAVALENNLLYRDMDKLLQDYMHQNQELELMSQNILKAHEEERKRIARDIHDGPAQSIVNLSLKAELCKKYMQTENFEKLTTILNDFNSNIRAAAKEIRTIIYDLKPSYLEEGLLKALESYFLIFKENTGIDINFTVSQNDKKIEYYKASTLYRIVQETMTNVSKHAFASKVDIDFAIKNGTLILKIKDNGKGFDTSISASKCMEGGFGLEGMRERVELIKGKLEIKSAPEKGTSIKITVPL